MKHELVLWWGKPKLTNLWLDSLREKEKRLKQVKLEINEEDLQWIPQKHKGLCKNALKVYAPLDSP